MPAIPLLSGSVPAISNPVADKNDPARVRDAACQFESLMIGQMMKSMHASGHGWLSDGEGDDEAGDTATQLAEEQFAQSLAKQGGLGLSRLIVSGLQSPPKSAGG